MSRNPKIILASKSPRRSGILKSAGFDFEVRSADTDESLKPGTPPEEAVVCLARRKAAAVKREADETVIGADTVVVSGGRILGKPKTADEAYKMLRALSGRTHFVYTGVCALKGEKEISFFEKTEVEFAEISDSEINEYIATGDCFDKAGAYGIQGYASRFVKGIRGDYFNVVGLPLSSLYQKIFKND